MAVRNLVLAVCMAVPGCTAHPPSSGSSRGMEAPEEETRAVLLAAGDIAFCQNLTGATVTARILENVEGEIAALGDLAYPDGTAQEFRDCYGKTWGRFKDRTHPAPGNHEYHSSGARPYFEYFGLAAGDPDKGYYSYDLGTWHLVALNSNCENLGGGCRAGSPQERWLRADVAAHRAACTLAYWHHPLFSSGTNPNHAESSFMKDIWVDLYGSHADIVLNGHEHKYERFAPQDPEGQADPNGIREFVVGTGGAPQDGFRSRPLQNSEVRDTGHFGVLKLALNPDSYAWEFIGEDSASFHDVGSGKCHGR